MGFKKQVKIRDIFYINDKPENAAVTRGNVKIIYHPPGAQQEKLTYNIKITSDQDITIASLITKYEWMGTCFDKKGSWACGSFSETEEWSDSIESPKIYTSPGINFEGLERHSGLIKRNLLKIGILNESVSSFKVYTKTGSTEHTLTLGKIEYTDKGIPYLTPVKINAWKSEGKGIYHQMGNIILDNESITRIDYTTQFENILNYNFTPGIAITNSKKTSINKIVWIVLAFVVCISLGIYWMYKQVV